MGQVPDKGRLEDILRTRIEALKPFRSAGGGYHSRIFLVETPGQDYVLKIPKGRQGWHTAYLSEEVRTDRWFDQHWAIETAHRLGIPAPEIVYSDREAGFVVMTRLPGEYVRDYEEWDGCPYDEAEFGSVLRRLHSVSLDGYGPVDDFGNTYCQTWPAFLTVMAQRMLEICSRRQSIGKDLHVLLSESWYPLLARLDSKRAALLHLESLGFANILYDPASRKITGFIDYEDCIGGDPLYELVWMCYYYGDRGSANSPFNFKRFEEGYGPWPEDDLAATLYKPFTYLDKLTWINPDGQRACWHRRALASLCRAL